ncbi:hypothetical protein G8770_06630 [Aestuariicella hydrocarbonica]|uniref:Uncharacterized protein n=1 Tax=Pseudomaricurvus hydrocarbonicus TaxID=1470433 RepID=A0A9E5JVA4_9GAMM|nr:hypothetical protein [Aestuariicella hydrocarbonica]NHO65216.1 hypothetical protein [Aestuariicella hydrocarbonica]
MSEILLCSQPLNSQALQSQCGISIDQISAFSCTKPTVAAANTPYIVGADDDSYGKDIVRQLSEMSVARELTSLSMSYGGDNVVALAEIMADLKEYNIGLIGASTSVYANRLGGFAGAVKDYQDALMAYRDTITSNTAAKAAAKQKALAAFQKLQFRFRHELHAVNAGVKSRRGTTLSNATRATNIARSSRSAAKLNVTSQAQANKLVKLAQHAKFLGNGLAVIDFTGRIGNVQASFQSGGEWERELFVESSSFALSAVAGTAAVNVGGAALSLLVMATPVGWVGLVIGGVTVAGVAAATSMGVNRVVKENSGSWYDAIMKVIGVI